MSAKISGKITNESRAHHYLEGILKGIGADGIVSEAECKALHEWLALHLDLADLAPFSDLYTCTKRIAEAGHGDPEEIEEVIEYCQYFESAAGPINQLTKEIRVLHGFLHGITADGVISLEEAKALKAWMNARQSLKDQWPFNDLGKMLKRILADNVISPTEHKELMAFCLSFSEQLPDGPTITFDQTEISTGPWMDTEAPVLKTIDHVCNWEAEIIFPYKRFCFTGQAKAGKRKYFHDLVNERGGIPEKNVVSYLDYLVIGANSNPCWAYSTYGRKIEKAMNLIKDGQQMQIIHETSFLDASSLYS